MNDEKTRLDLEAETALATKKMMELSQEADESDIIFAKRFIDAQHSMILALVNEKYHLLHVIQEMEKNNILEETSGLPSSNGYTLH